MNQGKWRFLYTNIAAKHRRKKQTQKKVNVFQRRMFLFFIFLLLLLSVFFLFVNCLQNVKSVDETYARSKRPQINTKRWKRRAKYIKTRSTSSNKSKNMNKKKERKNAIDERYWECCFGLTAVK